MKTIAAGKFKATCLAIMDEVQARRESVVITKNGKPVAKLIPVDLAGSGRSTRDPPLSRSQNPRRYRVAPLLRGRAREVLKPICGPAQVIVLDTHVVLWLFAEENPGSESPLGAAAISAIAAARRESIPHRRGGHYPVGTGHVGRPEAHPASGESRRSPRKGSDQISPCSVWTRESRPCPSSSLTTTPAIPQTASSAPPRSSTTQPSSPATRLSVPRARSLASSER